MTWAAARFAVHFGAWAPGTERGALRPRPGGQAVQVLLEVLDGLLRDSHRPGAPRLRAVLQRCLQYPCVLQDDPAPDTVCTGPWSLNELVIQLLRHLGEQRVNICWQQLHFVTKEQSRTQFDQLYYYGYLGLSSSGSGSSLQGGSCVMCETSKGAWGGTPIPIELLCVRVLWLAMRHIGKTA